MCLEWFRKIANGFSVVEGRLEGIRCGLKDLEWFRTVFKGVEGFRWICSGLEWLYRHLEGVYRKFEGFKVVYRGLQVFTASFSGSEGI